MTSHLASRSQPQVLLPCLGELPALHQIAWRAAPAGPPPRLLLDREIPHEPGMGAVFPEGRLLFRGYCKVVAAHTKTLSTTADILEEVKRRFLARPKAGVSTPQL